jgi:hypothetical protein
MNIRDIKSDVIWVQFRIPFKQYLDLTEMADSLNMTEDSLAKELFNEKYRERAEEAITNNSQGTAMAMFLKCFKDVDDGKLINANDYSNEDITSAIYAVAKMDTHNAISKQSAINALRWLLETWKVEDEESYIGKWIPVENGMPDYDEEVLVCNKRGRFLARHYHECAEALLHHGSRRDVGGWIAGDDYDDEYPIWDDQNDDFGIVAWCRMPEEFRR